VIRYDERGLVPVVVQDRSTLEVLMLAYANEEALRLTAETGRAHFFSRSRGRLWQKGETSGHTLEVEAVVADCDGDAVLYLVHASGPACHTGKTSCFHNPCWPRPGRRARLVLGELEAVIRSRRAGGPPSSYVAGLFARGEDAILKKVGEEATEVVLAAKDRDRAALRREMADLWFHSLIALVNAGISAGEVLQELEDRRR
jgi:phosphoribosyl-ATP pyrophosphohydrolase/phosphoribosyl-AMP cyclohydrolase